MSVLKMKTASFRLPQPDIDALIWYLTCFESEVGIRSNFQTVASVMALGSGEYDPAFAGMHVKAGHGPSVWHDPYTKAILNSTAKSRVIREILLDMIEYGYSVHVSVLHNVYGLPRKSDPFGIFGELAPIVSWTEEGQNIGTKDDIEKRMRDEDGGKVKVVLRAAADRLLSEASKKYLEAKERLERNLFSSR